MKTTNLLLICGALVIAGGSSPGIRKTIPLTPETYIPTAPMPLEPPPRTLPAAPQGRISIATDEYRRLTLSWIDEVNPPTLTSYNVYHKLTFTAPFELLMNTPGQVVVIPVLYPMEFFGVRAVIGGIESDWATE